MFNLLLVQEINLGDVQSKQGSSPGDQENLHMAVHVMLLMNHTVLCLKACY